jgi:hypothetical protein
MTGQVSAGDCLHKDDIARFDALVTKSRTSTDACTEKIRLSDSRIVPLQFRFSEGETLAIRGIFGYIRRRRRTTSSFYSDSW